jgi:hypothetical protein
MWLVDTECHQSLTKYAKYQDPYDRRGKPHTMQVIEAAALHMHRHIYFRNPQDWRHKCDSMSNRVAETEDSKNKNTRGKTQNA